MGVVKAAHRSRLSIPLPKSSRATRRVSEIEAAIERLPPSEVEKLAVWLETLRCRRVTETTAESWLSKARGIAKPGMTTDQLITLTRSDE